MVSTPWSGFHNQPQIHDSFDGNLTAFRRFILTLILTTVVFLTAPPARPDTTAKAGRRTMTPMTAARARTASQTETSGTAAWSRLPLGLAEFGALSQNGRWSVTTERGERVRVSPISGATAGRTLQNPTGHYLHYARVSSDGAWAVGVAKKAAVVWDLRTGRVSRVVEARPRADFAGFGAAASPDASTLAALQPDGSTQVTDARTGAVLTTHQGKPGNLFFCDDGSQVVTSASGEADGDQGQPSVEVWNARTGATSARFALDVDGADGCSVCWGLSPDGRRIAVADAEEGRLYLYDAARGAQPRVIESRLTRMTALRYSPDGRALITADAHGAQVRDAANGRVLAHLNAPESGIQHAAFSADGRWIATAGGDHMVRIWNAGSGKLVRAHRALANGAGFRLVQLTPDGGAVLGVGDDEESYLWRAGQASRTLVASKR